MLRHLKGNLRGSLSSDADVLYYKNLLESLTVPEIFMEPFIIETFFIDINNDNDRLNRQLQRYKNTCQVLLDTEDTIAKWLLKRGYKNVAIYGMGKLGKCLADRLSGTEVNVICGIDKKPKKFRNIEVIGMDEILSKQMMADVVIITPLYQYNEVANELLQRINIQCISIEHLLQ